MTKHLTNEELVNVFTTDAQDQPAIAPLTGGGYVIVWESTGQNGTGQGIVAQRYTADGQRVGGEILIEQTTRGEQITPDVTGTADGGFAVTWENQQSNDIMFRAYTAAGVAATPEITVSNDIYDSLTPSISARGGAGGGTIVTWVSYNNISNTYDIYGQRYSATHVAQGTPVQLNTDPANWQYEPDVAATANGFVAVWRTDSGQDIRARLFNNDGTQAVAEFTVNTATAGSQTIPQVVSLTGGGFVVVWQTDTGGDASGASIMAKVFNANGTVAVADFVANSVTFSTQTTPSVTATSDGGFFIAYHSTYDSNIAAPYNSYGEQFTAAGLRVGTAVQLNQSEAGEAYSPVVAGLANGKVVAVWEQTNTPPAGDGSGYGVYQRLFGPDNLVFAPQKPPVLGGLELEVTFSENALNAGAQLLDPSLAAAVSDLDSANFEGGSLRVVRLTNDAESGLGFEATQGADTVSVRNVGNGAGQVGVSGATVSFGGAAIGTITLNGTGTTDLLITFNASATAAAVEAVVENLTYRALSSDPNDQVKLAVYLEDGDGGSAVPQVITINITPDADGLEAVGSAQQVNSFTTSTQDEPDVAVLADGGWVVVWRSYNQETGSNGTYGVYGQRFDAQGGAVGPEFRVNTDIPSSQYQSKVAALDGGPNAGGFVVTWYDDGGAPNIRAQIYNASGAKVGGEITVETTADSTQYQPSIETFADGRFLISWSGYRSGASNSFDIKGQLFTAAGVKSGAELVLNSTITDQQTESEITLLSGGNLAVTWTSNNQDGSSNGIYTRVFNSAGVAQSAETLVNTVTTGSQAESDIAALTGGGYVVVFNDQSGLDGSGQGIFAQRFSAAGAKLGGQFLVHEYTPGTQQQPSVIGLADGGFAIAFSGPSATSSGYHDILVQQYDAAGFRVDDAIVVDQISADWGYAPRLDRLPNGDLIVVWQQSDGNAAGISQRIVGLPANYLAPGNEPVLGGLNESVTFTEAALNAGAMLLDADGAVAVSDPDSVNFDGGRLRIDRITGADSDLPFTAGDTSAQDVLGVRNQGNGAGQIGLTGNTLSFGGTVIGTLTLTNGSLVVTFNANATAQAVEAVIENVTYRNTSNDPVASRDFRVSLTDGDGGTAAPITITVNVTPEVETAALVGGLTQVNSYIQSTQQEPAAAALSGGGHVVVWASFTQDAQSTWGIYGQRYAADGAPVGPEFRANTSVAGSQEQAAVAGLSNGDFVVVWYNSSAPSGAYIQGQRFNADGSLDGAEFRVNTEQTSTQYQPSVLAVGAGFVVSWSSYNNESNTFDIRFQRYDNAGVVQGGEVTVNTVTAGQQYASSLATNGTGFVVVWEDQDGLDGSSYGVYAQRYSATGVAQGSNILVNTTTAGNQYQPDVAELGGGGFVVVWRDDSGRDGSGSAVFGQLFTAAGAKVGAEFLVNDAISSNQFNPRVTGLDNGGFAVVFDDQGGNDGYGSGVLVQEFYADGTRRDGSRAVSEGSQANESQGDIVALGGGNYAVILSQSQGQRGGDGEGQGIFQQFFGSAAVLTGVATSPQLSEFGPNVTYSSAQMLAGAQVLDNAVELTDSDSVNFDGGILELSHLNYNATADDQIGVATAGGITRVGNAISFNGTQIGAVDAVANGVNGASLRIVLDADANAVNVRALIEALTYRNTNATPPTNQDRVIGLRLTDGDGGQIAGTSIIVEINPTISTPPSLQLSDLDGPTFTENSLQVAGGQIIDAGLDFEETGSSGFNGGSVFITYETPTNRTDAAFETLAVRNTGGGADQIGVAGSAVSYQGVQIGTIDGTQSGLAGAGLRVLLNANATEAGVDALLESISYRNTSDGPPPSVNLNFRVTDSTTGNTFDRPVTITITPQDDGGPKPLGDEEQVNSYTPSNQQEPAIAALADGGYVTVWQSYGQNQSGAWDVYAQRYGADGTPVGGEVLISNSLLTGNASQYEPAVVGLTGGGYAIAWFDNQSSDVFVRVANSAGVLGAEIQGNVQTSSTQQHPTLAQLPGGGFVLGWASQTSAGAGDGNGVGVIGRVFNASGVAQTGEIILNTSTSSTQDYPSIASYGAAGGFVAVWESYHTGLDAAPRGVYGQLFTSAGVKIGGEFLINTTTAGDQYSPEVTRLTDGGFVVAWQSPDGSGTGIYQQRYTAAGVATGGEVIVNSRTSSQQEDAQVIGTPDGGWVVAWTDHSGADGSSYGVFGQRYASDGSRIDGAFLINDRIQSTQYQPDIAVLNSGILATIWSSYNDASGGDGAEYGVFHRLFGNPATQLTSTDPVIAGLEANRTVTETAVNTGPVTLDATGALTVSDSDSGNFDGGTLSITRVLAQGTIGQFAAPDNGAQDVLSIATGGRITIVGSDLRVDVISIGTITSTGAAGSPLTVTLNAGSTADRVEAVLEAVRYQNPSDDPAAERTFRVVLNDGDGGSSSPVLIKLTVTPELDGVVAIEGEAQVNSYTPGTQDESRVAGLTGGGHVVVWGSTNQDNEGVGDRGVFGQLFDQSGQAIGPEFQINTTFRGTQSVPDVVALGDGGFVVAWSGTGIGDNGGIFFQRYNANGVAQDIETRVNNDVAGTETDVDLAASATRFAVVYADSNGDGSSWGVRIKIFDNAGVAQGVETTVNTFQTSTQDEPAVAALSDGSFIVTWRSYNQDDVGGNDYGVFAQRVSSAGTLVGGEFRVNTVVNGQQYEPDVAGLTNATYVVVWRDDNNTDGSSAGVYGQIYTNAGVAVGGNFLVNEVTANAQYQPRVVGLPDGGFVVAWSDNNGTDGSGNGVFGQQYDNSGARIDGNFRINEEFSSTQYQPALSALYGRPGAFVSSWTSSTSGTAGDGNGEGVFQRIFGNPADFPVVERPVLQALNETVTYQENTVNAGPLLLDADGAVALSDLDSSNFDGGFLNVNHVIGGRGYNDQINPPDDQTQHVLGLRQAAGISISGSNVLVDGIVVGTIASSGLAGADFRVLLNASATVAAVERLIENLTYRNTSNDPEPSTLVRVQVNDGDGNSSDPQVVNIRITAQTDGASKVLSERQANTFETGQQEEPHVVRTNEGFVMVWQSYGQDAVNTWGVYGQRFDDLGNKIGGEFLVNTTVAGTQVETRAAGLNDGGFVVTWFDQSGTDGSGNGVFMQRYNAAGAKVGGETVVNQTTVNQQGWQDVTVLSNGNILVTWEAAQVGSTSYDVYARLFNPATGVAIAGEFKVNTTLVGNQDYPAVTELAGGGFVIAWEQTDANSLGVFAQRFNDAGVAQGGEFQLNTSTDSTQDEVHLVGLTGGGFVAVWESNEQDGSSDGVFARMYNASGVPQGEEFRVNDQRAGQQYQPQVAALENGGFVVVFADSNSTDGSGYGVFAQQYDALGARVDGQIQVNTETSSTQYRPTVAGLPGGGFVVGWESQTSATAGDGSSTGVFYQIYGNSPPTITNVLVNGTEDTVLVLPIAPFTAAFADADGQDLQSIRIDVLPVQGELRLNTVPVAPGALVTAAQIAAGQLTFIPPANFNGTIAFGWAGSDGLAFSALAQANLILAPVNDAVALEAGGNAVVGEGTFFSRQLTIGDPDTDTFRITVDYGDGTGPQVFNTNSKTPSIGNTYSAEGTYTVSVTVNDQAGTPISIESDSFQVTVQNAAPTARDDYYTTNEDTAVIDNLFESNGTGADTDPGGDVFTVTHVNGVAYTLGSTLTLPSGATVVIQANGNVVYNPAPGFQALAAGETDTDSFTYTITDNGGLADNGTVFITVNGQNDNVVARNDALTVNENSALGGSLFADNGNGVDFDPEGDAISITSVNGSALNVGNVLTLPGGGALTVNANGTFSFNAAGQYEELDTGESQVVSFTYVVTEAGAGQTASATAQVTITGVNDAPVANADSYTTTFNTTLGSFDPRSNDGDVDGEALTISSFSQPAAGGVVSQNLDGTLRFVPTAGFSGPVMFQYTASDGTATSTANVTITVGAAPNSPPDAVNDAATVAEDGTVLVSVLSNDTDANGNPLTITGFGQGANGVVMQEGGQLRYTPNANFNGSDSFTYAISDGQGGSDSATVNVIVNPVNDAPDAVNDGGFTTAFNTALVIAPAALLANDTDGDPDVVQTLTIQSVQGATGGTVALVGGNVQFTPTTGFSGAASFTYTINDGAGGTDTATVNLSVSGPTNAAPAITSAAAVSVAENQTGAIDVNATDADAGQTLTYSISGGADAALFTINGSTGLVSFVAAPNFEAPADAGGNNVYDLVVRATDNGAPSLFAEQAVAITVTNVNEAPTADADGPYAATEDTQLVVSAANGVLAGDTDPDAGTTLTAELLTTTTNGALTLNANGSFSYTPNANFNGTDSFSYRATDGALATAPVTVTINVAAVNDAPDAVNDGGFTTAFNTALVIAPAALLANDTDGDPDVVQTLTIQSVQGATGGTVALVGGNVQFTPTTGFSGAASFTYTINDGAGGTDTATVNLSVSGPTNAAPAITSAAAVSVAENQTGAIDVNATDADAGQTLTYSISGGADAALFTINGSTGLVSFVAAPNFEAPADAGGNNVYDLVVRATDNGAPSLFAEQAVAITVTNVNEAPTADADGPYAATEDTQLVVSAANGVLAGDTDPDAGTTLTAELLTTTTNGALTLNANGSFSYTPNANFNGTDSFSYRATDGALATAPVTVTINVAAVNDAPDAVNDGGFTTAFNTALVIAPAALLANDTDGDPDVVQTLTIQSVQGATGGTVALVGGNVQFTPTTGFSGAASFTYTINDGAGGTDTATVNLSVSGPTNAAPAITSAAAVSVAENQTGAIDVNATDADAGQTLTYSISGGADAALFTINGSTGLVSFVAAPNFEAPADAGGNNVYDLVVRATDNGAPSLFAEQAVAITVTNVNEAPTADADGPYAATEDTQLVVSAANGVLAGDTDPDAGTTLTAELLTTTTNGALTLNANGSFSYTPNANFNGTDSFSYRATDGALATAPVTVTINVAAVNDAPDAVNDGGFTTAFNTALVIAPAALLANDTDGDPDVVQTLTIQSVQGATGGTVALVGGNVQFTPTTGFSGAASFTYTINDGAGGTDTATVNLSVSGPTNAAPAITSAAAVSVAENQTGAIDVNATDADAGQTLTYSISGGADAALFTINGSTGLVSFVAAPNFEAPADAGGNNVYDLVVRATDNGAPSLFAEQAVAITVTNVNEAPTADADGPYAATEDTQLVVSAANGVLAGDTDPDAGTTLTAELLTTTTNGALTLNANGSFSYTPNANFNGTDSFSYRATDGALATAPVTVTINVAAVNDAPDAVNDGGFTTAFNTALVIAPAALLANDTDGDPDVVQTLTIQSVQGATGGTVALVGGNVQFTPTTGFSGAASFTYTINDGAGGTDTATVRLVVNGVVTPPTGVNNILGTPNDDPALNGGDGRDLIFGRSGNDRLTGGGDSDTLNGAGGNDTLSGGGGADFFRIDGREIENRYARDTITDLSFAEGDRLVLASFGPAVLKDVAGGNPLLVIANGTSSGVIIDSFADFVELDMASTAVSFSRLGVTNSLVMKIVDSDGDIQDVVVDNAVAAFLGAGGTLEIPGLPSSPPPGANVVPSTSGNDNLLGTVRADWIDGGDGNDVMFGRAGNDTLIGGSGNDRLNGAQDDDLLFGGTGADQFRFDGREIAGGSDTDTVLDLSFAEGDTMVLASFGAGVLQGVAGGNPLAIIGPGTGVIIDSYADIAELAAASAAVTTLRIGLSDTLVLRVTDTDGDVLNMQLANSFAAYSAAGGVLLI